MDCHHCEEIISASLDGEATAGERDLAARHLDRCAACRAFEADLTALHRATRLAPADEVPDLTPRILEADRARRGEETQRALRVVLATVGLAQIVLALPALLGAEGGLSVHDSRHLGSFDVALAVGFLYAAWRPQRALAGVLPVAAVLVACLVGTSVLDVVAGRAEALGELPHVSELVGLTALWLLAPPSARRPSLRVA